MVLQALSVGKIKLLSRHSRDPVHDPSGKKKKKKHLNDDEPTAFSRKVESEVLTAP